MIGLTSSATHSLRFCVKRTFGINQLSSRSYVTKPAWAASKTATGPQKSSKGSNEFATTSASELHPLPSSVKNAAKPSSSSDAERYDELGNSVSPADISSRPSGPGPSGPVTDAEQAAPRYTKGSMNGEKGNSSALENVSSSFDWATSFNGMSTVPFSQEVAQVLEEPINEDDIEIKPDGLLYLPEIKYRRILNRAFGPGGWGLAPRSETNVSEKVVSREWALICLGRFVSTARGEQEYFDPSGVATATEAAKSNALMRCCKDLGIAHELWSPRFIRSFKEKKCVEVFVENVSTHKKRKLWRRKDGAHFEYPWKESK